MRSWQVERRKRTRHLIELGGRVVKADIVEQAGDDRAMISGTMIWITENLQSKEEEKARTIWTEKGKQAFEADHTADVHSSSPTQQDRA